MKIAGDANPAPDALGFHFGLTQFDGIYEATSKA